MSTPVEPIVIRRFDGKVTIDKNELEFRDRVIPKERFVEYEPSDLDWMIPLGMVPRREIPKHVIDRVGQRVRDIMEFYVFWGIVPGKLWSRV